MARPMQERLIRAGDPDCAGNDLEAWVPGHLMDALQPVQVGHRDRGGRAGDYRHRTQRVVRRDSQDDSYRRRTEFSHTWERLSI